MTTKNVKSVFVLATLCLSTLYLYPSRTENSNTVLGHTSDNGDEETMPAPGGLKKKLIFPKKESLTRGHEAAVAYLKLYD